MAIQFLQDIDLNLAEIKEVVVDKVSGNPGGQGQVEGRLIYETNSNQLRYFNGTAYVACLDYNRWVLKDNASTPATVDVDSTDTVQFTSNDIDYVVASAGGGSTSMSSTLKTVNSNVGTFTNATVTVNAKGLVTAASSGTGGGTLSKWVLSSNNGSASVVNDIDSTRNTVDFRSSQGTIIPSQTTPTAASARLDFTLNYGPSTANNTIITAAGAAGALDNTDTMIVSQAGESGNTSVKETTLSALKTFVAPGSGGMTFKGGYNANTNSPDIGDATLGIDIAVGDTYVVTVAGSFFTDTVEVGDLIISEVAKSSGSSVALTDYVVVNKNIGLATTTTPGIASFPSNSGLAVTAAGAVDIADTAVSAGNYGSASAVPVITVNARGQITAASTAAISTGNNSAVATEGNTSNPSVVYTHNLGSKDVIVQIYDNDSESPTNGETVFAEVARTSTNAVTVTYANTITSGQYRVLCIKIG